MGLLHGQERKHCPFFGMGGELDDGLSQLDFAEGWVDPWGPTEEDEGVLILAIKQIPTVGPTLQLV
jgi:hypothetical protein